MQNDNKKSKMEKNVTLNICKPNMQNPKCKTYHTEYAHQIFKIQNAKTSPTSQIFTWYMLNKLMFSLLFLLIYKNEKKKKKKLLTIQCSMLIYNFM